MADITIISMGPGAPELLTDRARQALEVSEILIGSDKFKKLYPGLKMEIPENIISGTKEIISRHIDKKIGVMVTGDAGFYSLAKSVIGEFGKENVNIIPGVSVVQTAFAKLAEPWEGVQFISLHGRKSGIPEITADRFMILCDKKNTAADTAAELIDSAYEIYVMEDLESDNEKIIHVSSEADLKKVRDISRSIVIGIRRED